MSLCKCCDDMTVALVLVATPRSSPTHLNDVLVCAALVGFIILGVFQKDLVHVGAGILEQLVRAIEDDESNLAVA